jgi:hypothetical protein
LLGRRSLLKKRSFFGRELEGRSLAPVSDAADGVHCIRFAEQKPSQKVRNQSPAGTVLNLPTSGACDKLYAAARAGPSCAWFGPLFDDFGSLA